jgi:spermidine synthase
MNRRSTIAAGLLQSARVIGYIPVYRPGRRVTAPASSPSSAARMSLQSDQNPPQGRRDRRAAVSLFLLGFVTLFLELCLIRYMAGSIWNLGYFPNLVLMGVFVGMGTGFVCHQLFSTGRARALFCATPFALLLLTLFVRFLHPDIPGFDKWSGDIGGELFYTATPRAAGPASYLLFLVWFLGVIVIFAMISQYTAKIFARFRPLTAYTLDILGSCCGIASFMAVSFLQIPAGIWFLLLTPLFLAIPASLSGREAAGLLLPLVFAAVPVFEQDTRLMADPGYEGPVSVRWSPYQKIEFIRPPGRDAVIFVNGIIHQAMHPLSHIGRSFYQAPYDARSAGNPGGIPGARVLIMGAGSGNDVASALLNGAKQVDAVEIDPVIVELGRRHHPAKPYSDPRVNSIIDDARAFMTHTNRRYDLVVFALTDSVVKVSPMAQLRLENYLFTRESVARAYSLLTEGGALVFYNFYRRPWLVQKIRSTIWEATGRRAEKVHQEGDFAVLTVSRSSAQEKNTPRFAGVVPATDDWPFPYLRSPTLPTLYLVGMAVLVGYMIALLVFARAGAGRLLDVAGLPVGASLKLAFALMGTAFLLLETKSIIQFSLLFGTTWLNNSLVFLAILLLVLLANWTAHKMCDSRSIWVVFALLMATSLFTLYYPLSNLLYLEERTLRLIAASLLTFSPVFFANLLFSIAFKNQRAAELLFGWNLLGATIGGVLEYSSMALGYNALAGVVAFCYLVAFVLLLRGRSAVSTLS